MARQIISGIYRIVDGRTGASYIGRSIDIHSRLIHHFAALRSGTHRNPKLQDAWDCRELFEFRSDVLEVAVSGLRRIEQRWIEREAPSLNIKAATLKYCKLSDDITAPTQVEAVHQKYCGLPISIDGVEYPSMRAAGKVLGVSCSTIRRWKDSSTKKYLPGTAPNIAKSRYIYNGAVFRSRRALARALGVHHSSIAYHVERGSLERFLGGQKRIPIPP